MFFVSLLVLTGCQAIFSPFAPVGTPFFVSGLIKTNAMCATCWCQVLCARGQALSIRLLLAEMFMERCCQCVREKVAYSHKKLSTEVAAATSLH